MVEIHHHQQQQEQQQILVNEAQPSPIFNQNNQQYSNYQPPQQMFQQLQNLPTTHEFFHYQQSYLHQQQQLQDQFHQEQQRRLLLLQDHQSSVSQNGGRIEVEDGNFVGGSRRTVPVISHSWENQEDSAIRQHFWKHFGTDISGRKYKRGVEAKDKEEDDSKMNQNKDYGDYDDEETEQISSSNQASKRSRLFGELEAICGHAAAPVSGSSLNGQDLSKATIQEQPPSRMVKKRKKMKDEMSSMAHFFECLVKKLMDNQEVFYNRFVDMIEKIDEERKEREKIWRKQYLEKLQSEVTTKAHERALASSREASIVEYLEKIAGQSINIINLPSSLESNLEISTRGYNVENVMSKRWPKAEVEALIQIRTKLEPKFQEPGLIKGLLWKDVCNSMASMGFQRNAKRCKEKWENINKYFKKFKENPNVGRRQKLSTCEYFDQLEQFYGKEELPSDNQENIKGMDFEGSSNEKFQDQGMDNNGQIEEAEDEDFDSR